MTSYITEQKAKWILIDGGLDVNIMPKSIINYLENHSGSLFKKSNDDIRVQPRELTAIDMIHLKLTIGDLSMPLIFHAINYKTSYSLLLRCLWLYKHGIVASTFHQCLKYYRGGKRNIL